MIVVRDATVVVLDAEVGSLAITGLRMVLSGLALTFLAAELLSAHRVRQVQWPEEDADATSRPARWMAYSLHRGSVLWVVGLGLLAILARVVSIEPGQVKELNLFGGKIRFEQDWLQHRLLGCDRGFFMRAGGYESLAAHYDTTRRTASSSGTSGSSSTRASTRRCARARSTSSTPTPPTPRSTTRASRWS